MTDTAAQGDARTMLVQRLTYMHDLMRWIDGRWQEKAAVARSYQPPARQKTRWGVGRASLLAVGVFVASLTIASPVTDAVYGVLVTPFVTEEWANANDGVMIVILLAIPAVGSVALALLTVIARNTFWLPRQQARIQQADEQREKHNAAVRAHELQIDAQLLQAGRDYAQQVGTGFFPEHYLYEEAVAFCIGVVQNHRANTVTDALNLFETDLHRRRMEDMQAQQLAGAERASRQQAMLGVLQAGLTGAAIATMRAEGRATRTANASEARRITEELKKPVTVRVRRGFW